MNSWRSRVSTDRAAVEDFLYEEAALLDAADYRAWIELFTEDGRYWAPAEHVDDPQAGVSLVCDDRQRLQERLLRAESRFFWAQQPPSQTSRLVGNVRVCEADDGLRVESRFHVAELRRGRERLLAGTYSHWLVHEQGRLRIREKVAVLINRSGYFGNLSFLL